MHLALADSLAVAVQRSADRVRPGRLPRRHGGRRGAARRRATSRATPAGLAAAWAHYRPQLAVTEPTAAAHAFLLDPPLPPRIRWPYRVIAAAAAATLPPDLRPLLSGRPLLPDLPARVVGRAATRLLAGVLGESPAAAAAHRRTGSAAQS